LKIKKAIAAFTLFLALAAVQTGANMALAEDGKVIRAQIDDPAAITKGMYFDRLRNILGEDFAYMTGALKTANDDMRNKISENVLPTDDYARELITAWDALIAIELQRATILNIFQNAPPAQQNQQLSLAQHTQHNADGTTTTLPLSIAQILNVHIAQHADERLADNTSPQRLPSRVTITSSQPCGLPEGTFDVVQNGYALEITDAEQIRYFGIASSKEIWLWANTPRFARIETGKGLSINAPDAPGLVVPLAADADGFSGSELGNPSCIASVRPAN